jgi:hypothetical protein
MTDWDIMTQLSDGSTLNKSMLELTPAHINDAFNKFDDMSEIGEKAIVTLKQVCVCVCYSLCVCVCVCVYAIACACVCVCVL